MKVHNRSYSFFHFNLFLASFFGLFLALSCSKEPIRENPGDTNPDPPSATFDDGIFVVNEGNYNWGNATITYIDNTTNTIEQDLFERVNQHGLGDVAQSMKVYKNMGFIVVNNSNRLEVVNIKDFKSIKSIEGFSSPRYIEIVDSTKAYVTNLRNDITVVNLRTLTISNTIKTNSWTEGIIKYGKYIYVTCVGNFNEPNSNRHAQVLIIDTDKDRIIDSIQTGKEPLAIVVDRKNSMWVLCTGGYDSYEPASILRINPDLRIVEKVFNFQGISGVPSKLCINPTRDTIYYLKGGVYQMPVSSLSLPAQAFVTGDGHLFYGLDIHPKTGNIFVSDAVDYVQNGKAYQYSPKDGQLIHEYSTGRIPGSFCFSPAK